MLSPDLLEDMTQKVGGRFRLTSLLQKRSRELCLGAPRLTEMDSERPHEIALAEAHEDKIYLTSPEEAADAAEEKDEES